MWFESMHASWQEALSGQRLLLDEIETDLVNIENLTPPADKVMRAFEQPLDQVRVLLVGQDPYPEQQVACGLAFAIDPTTSKIPASLRNILTELRTDQPQATATGRVERWQSQGVMLLNRNLTTLVGESNAHEKAGWQDFTDAVIDALVQNRRGHLVALLWGKQAQQLTARLGGVTVVAGVHPSPLSAYRGFFGSRPFSAVNRALEELGQSPVDWSC
jgi:uracil-DNA glycosylase